MKPQIPWPRIFAEGTAIVVSILLAFGIQAWWTQVQDRQQAAVHVAGLTLDIESDATNWRSQEAGLARKRESLERVLAWLSSPGTAEILEPELLDDLIAGGRFTYGAVAFRTQRTTFDELINTGGLRLLRPSLRRALLEYHAAVDFCRSAVAERDTDYAKRILEVIPRASGFRTSADLSESERRRIGQRLQSDDVESLALAELNRSFFHEDCVESVRIQANDLLSLLESRIN